MFSNLFKSFKILWFLLYRRQKIYFLLAFFLGLISALLEMLSIAAVGRLFLAVEGNDNIIDDNFFNIFYLESFPLPTLIIIFVLIILISGLSKSFYTYFSCKVCAKISTHLSKFVFNNTINQDYQEFIYSNSSKVLSIISKQIEQCTIIILSLFNFGSFTLISLALLYAITRILSLNLILFVLIIPFSYFILIRSLKNRIEFISKGYSNIIQNQTKFIQETISMFKDININKTHKNIEKEFTKIDFKRRLFEAEINYLSSIPRDLLGVIAILALISVALIYFNNDEKYILPSLAALGLACQKIIPAFQGIYSSLLLINSNSEALKEVSNNRYLLNKKIKIDIPKNIDFSKFYSLSAKNISFKYRNKKNYALVNKSLKIYQGKFIAIKGASGCGKSTLMDLFLGLIKPNKGKIFVNDIPLDKCLLNWHKLIGYVGQSVHFSDTSIEENLFMNQDSSSKYEIDNILEIVGIKKFLQKSDLNFGSRVGEEGRLLSRGQRQRIGIARILLSNPKVLFLDEATNGLEYNSEREVYKNLRKINDLTVIAITHSQSLDNCFDQIIDLRN
tara:strand:+ start:2299 stop:3984 length:1686 start_codon:yes stop_codon:yes gene_type:complete